MNKFIVTTTIYEPSEATLKFSQMSDWTMIVVGDKKTPHDSYRNINVIYLDPEYQETNYRELSDAIGWNCVMRRNIGFIEAYKRGADIVATIDDDNIPYDNWGQEILVGSEYNEIHVWDNATDVFDPMSLTNHPEFWHRGFPVQLVKQSTSNEFKGVETRKVLFQADLWNGDPDIDAICRMLYSTRNLTLKTPGYYFSTNNYAPFNSQNTFIAREALPFYMVLPHVGRMDDIWGGYIAQYLLDTRPVYGDVTVYQDRNEQSLQKNFEDEFIGYKDTLRLIRDIENYNNYLPEKARIAFELYRKEYTKNG
jgi:hypothetical protein